ncbi:choline-sulfatase [Brenneria tiliae]|uniref:choline-sulfatase n=1 Tax=Brenneria tiliae TaxID=2914984 RepID=UPI002014CE2B|nr:choline-sulfatase [Brenneria tiliae]MCL2896906.1 choline-sulfatase [Brenneria tiliae]MCL2901464.1 choline-sulfatase [Brenneria tiliae]
MLSRKPNIVILMADQLTAGALSAYGNKITKTPNIDKLSRQGVVFESAYCNSPLCAPSRATLMTGLLNSANNVFDNAAEFSAEQPTFCHYLRVQGYHTILAGKMHFCGPDQLHGFNERLTTDIYPADFGWTPDWRNPEVRLDWYHNMSSVIDAGTCIRTNQLDFDDEAVFLTRQKLFDIARQGNQQPFMLLMSLTHPHDPFAIPQPYLDRYSPQDIDLPQVNAAQVPSDPHSRRLRKIYQLTDDLLSDEQVRRARHAYYGAVSYVDDQFGAVLATLEETGLAEDTIVLVISDHGEMLGERGLWYKMGFFEGAARIPFIVHAPDRFAAHRVDASVSLADLLPTLVELAGGEPSSLPATLAGHSLLPHLRREAGHDGVYAEYLAEGALAPIVMIRRGDWKYVHSLSDPELLFNLREDPHELNNLAADAACLPVLSALRDEVASRWDLPALHQRVLQSQQNRLFLNRALTHGTAPAWDYQPVQDASRRYIRNNQTLDEQEAVARFPRPHSSSPNQ